MLMNTAEYLSIIENIKSEIRAAQYRAAVHVNADMLLLYYDIGCVINEHKSWGNKFIDNLAADIRIAFPESKGYSVRNLKYMAKFAEIYPDREFVQQVVAQIPWGHNIVLLDKVADMDERKWYAKLFLIKLQQEDGKSYSSIHTIRGVLRPAFQMAVDDDILVKNPFGFQLAGVLVNDAVTREAITKDQMRKFLKFVHDDVVYCKYYEVVYILFHTGMRISEFCGLTLKDIDLENRTVNIDHQLQRTSDMRYIIETTKTDAGTRVLPITEEVVQMFQAIIEDRNAPKVEKSIDGYSGFLFYDDNGMPLVAMHWQHRFNHMVGRYNDIYRVQMPNITPHVCRHTYCSNMAKSGMNPKTLQYLIAWKYAPLAIQLPVGGIQ